VDPEEGNLSEAPEEEETEKIDLDDILDRMAGDGIPGAAAEVIRTQLSVIEESSQAAQVSEALQTFLFGQNISDPRLVTNGAIPDLLSALDRVQTTIRDSSIDQRGYNVSRVNTLFAGVAAFSTIISTIFGVYAAMRGNSQSGPKQPSSVDTETIDALVREWSSYPNDKFWGAIATYIDANKDKNIGLTLGDQVQMMTYIIDLFPLVDPWIWSDADLKAAITYLVYAYTSAGNDSAAMYRAIPAYTFNGNSLPRSVAATVARFAIATIVNG
jgi:hypothetical protein